MARPMTDDEFTELVHAAWPGLYRTAYLMLGDHQLAEDLTQTALAKTYASWRKVKDPAAAPAYARVVLAHTAASWFRKRGWRNERPVELLPETGTDPGTDPGTRTMLLDAIATLAPRQRAVVVLRYYEDMSVREVAHALGISEGTVKSQTSDALGRLRDVLDDEAAAVEVPVVDAAAVVGAGRRIRRDRQVRAVVAGATVVLVGAVAAAVLGLGRDAENPEPARPAYERLGAWADSEQVHIGDTVVDIPSTQWIRYTTVGALVGTLDPSAWDTPPWAVFLVRPDGSVTSLGRLGAVAADPAESVVVYARQTDGEWQMVTRDLAGTGEVEQPVGEPWRGGYGQDVVMAGRYVAFEGGGRDRLLDWRTGELLETPPGPASVMPSHYYGRAGVLTATQIAARPITEWQLRSLPDGDVVGTYPDGGREQARVSPDGRYLLTGDDTSSFVYEVASGERLPLRVPASPSAVGWTPDGHVLALEGAEEGGPVVVCDPQATSCEPLASRSGPGVVFGAGAA